jgi:hypothetical protein
MSTRSGPTSRHLLFLGLAVSQAAHSVEEYVFRLFEVLAPTRYLIGLLTDNLSLGFAIVNAMVVAFMFWTWFFRVRPESPHSAAWIWGWSILQLGNGIGHILLAIDAGGYFPGVLTAPFLLTFSLALIWRLVHPVARTPIQ